MRYAVAVLLLCGATLTAADPGVTLELPRGKTTSRLQVIIDGDTSTIEWSTFRDELFAWFDRDNNGALDRKEIERMVPLPLPGGKTLTIMPGTDGKLSKDYFKEFCR